MTLPTSFRTTFLTTYAPHYALSRTTSDPLPHIHLRLHHQHNHPMSSTCSTSYTPYIITFIAGLLTALLITLLTSRRDDMRRGLRSGVFGAGKVWGWFVWLGTRKGKDEEMVEGEEDDARGRDGSVDGKDEGEAGDEIMAETSEVVSQRKPFEFRARLWYEPPEDDVWHFYS